MVNVWGIPNFLYNLDNSVIMLKNVQMALCEIIFLYLCIK